MAGASPVKPGPGHIVKFVGHDATGLPVKRKQVHQACLPCRKRKVFLISHISAIAGRNIADRFRNVVAMLRIQSQIPQIQTNPTTNQVMTLLVMAGNARVNSNARRPLPTGTRPMPPPNCSASSTTPQTRRQAAALRVTKPKSPAQCPQHRHS